MAARPIITSVIFITTFSPSYVGLTSVILTEVASVHHPHRNWRAQSYLLVLERLLTSVQSRMYWSFFLADTFKSYESEALQPSLLNTLTILTAVIESKNSSIQTSCSLDVTHWMFSKLLSSFTAGTETPDEVLVSVIGTLPGEIKFIIIRNNQYTESVEKLLPHKRIQIQWTFAFISLRLLARTHLGTQVGSQIGIYHPLHK